MQGGLALPPRTEGTATLTLESDRDKASHPTWRLLEFAYFNITTRRMNSRFSVPKSVAER